MGKFKKAVLITGGTSGIGYSIVMKYLQNNFFVVINYCHNGKNIIEVKKDLKNQGFIIDKDYILVQADVGDEKKLFNVLESIPTQIKDSIEVLVNNAGALKRGDVLHLTQEDWMSIFNVNVFGVINCSKWFYEKCKMAKSIVNIGSIRGYPHIARTNNIAYSVSKSTIPTLTAALAKSFGKKIRVNSILPGTIDTPQRQGVFGEDLKLYGESNAILKRLGQPKEIADICLFLTENATYMTGSSVVIDGGYMINYIR